MREWAAGPKRVAVVGLGAGSLAAYAQPGDTFRFYEINPQVTQLARQYFFYLSESKAPVTVTEGDARLSLEREHIQPFDILVLDAFSGDAIPVHLLTKEAMALYIQRLKPDGVMAFHISNDFLDLAPVVGGLAESAGYQFIAVKNHSEPEDHVFASEWVLVTRNSAILNNDALKLHAIDIPARPDLREWTDEFNSLLPVLKSPEIR